MFRLEYDVTLMKYSGLFFSWMEFVGFVLGLHLGKGFPAKKYRRWSWPHMIIQFAKSFISYLSKAFHFSYNFFRICISSFVSLKNLHEAFFTPNFYFLSDNCINNFQPPSISVFRVLKATFFVLHFSSLTKFHAEYSTFDLLSFLLFPSIHWIQAFLFYNLREIHFVGNLKSRLNAVLYCVLCFSFKIFGI